MTNKVYLVPEGDKICPETFVQAEKHQTYIEVIEVVGWC